MIVCKKFIMDGFIKPSIKFQKVLTKQSENFHFQKNRLKILFTDGLVKTI